MGAATDNDTARRAMNLLYNKWFTSWRDRIGNASDEDLRQCLDEGNEILRKYPSAFSEDIARALLRELRRRAGEHV